MLLTTGQRWSECTFSGTFLGAGSRRPDGAGQSCTLPTLLFRKVVPPGTRGGCLRQAGRPGFLKQSDSSITFKHPKFQAPGPTSEALRRASSPPGASDVSLCGGHCGVQWLVDFSRFLMEVNHEFSLCLWKARGGSQHWLRVRIPGVAFTKAKAWVPHPEILI